VAVAVAQSELLPEESGITTVLLEAAVLLTHKQTLRAAMVASTRAAEEAAAPTITSRIKVATVVLAS
jgi:hypothetical protein